MKTWQLSIWVLIMWLAASSVAAEEWSLEHNDRNLRAKWQAANASDGKAFVLLHGTLAHNKMEIMTSLQQALAERDMPSLAINLSLGVDQRPSTNFPCSSPHAHSHENASLELAAWVNHLSQRGYNRLVLVGHSRGGNQVAQYLAATPKDAVRGALLLAPMVEAPSLNSKQQMLLEQAATTEWFDSIDFLYCTNARVRGATFRSYYGLVNNFATLSLLQGVSVPVAVIGGSDDTVVANLPQHYAALQDQGRLEHVPLVMLDGADHFFLDLYIEDIADYALKFTNSMR